MTLLDKGKSLEITRQECWFSVTPVSTIFRFANKCTCALISRHQYYSNDTGNKPKVVCRPSANSVAYVQ